MKPETEARLNKIKRVSKVMRIICKVAMGLAICVSALAVIGILSGHGTINFPDYNIAVEPLALPARLPLATATAVILAVGIKGLYHLNKLLGNYGRGEIFTTESARQIRQLGITALLWYGANILCCIATVLAVRPTPTEVQFHSDSLVTGGVIIVISWFMEMAAEMREENELTI